MLKKAQRAALFSFYIVFYGEVLCRVRLETSIIGLGFFQPLALVWFLHTNGFLSSVWYVSRNPYSTYKSTIHSREENFSCSLMSSRIPIGPHIPFVSTCLAALAQAWGKIDHIFFFPLKDEKSCAAVVCLKLV